MRRLASITVVSVLTLAACGGGSDGDDVSTPNPGENAETDGGADDPQRPENDPGAPESESPIPISEPDPVVTEPAATDTDPEAPIDPNIQNVVDINMVEWTVESPADIIPGSITFNVTNSGEFPHHFAIARGESYETLPQTGGGAIDEDTLGDDFLGRTSNISAGASESIEFDLEPGNYVFFCNIAGTVSHAAQGQVLSVTVAPTPE